MPDTYGLTNRPVVRKLSATQNDLFKKFDRRDSTGDSSVSLSSSGTTTPLLRSRQGSIKKVRSKAEVSLSKKGLFIWISPGLNRIFPPADLRIQRFWVWFCLRLISVEKRETHDLMQGQIRDWLLSRNESLMMLFSTSPILALINTCVFALLAQRGIGIESDRLDWERLRWKAPNELWGFYQRWKGHLKVCFFSYVRLDIGFFLRF